MLLFVAVEMSLTSMAIPKPNEHTDEASKQKTFTFRTTTIYTRL